MTSTLPCSICLAQADGATSHLTFASTSTAANTMSSALS